MTIAELNPTAQYYWPRAFAYALRQVETFRRNVGLWARFLQAGLLRHHADDRWGMLHRFLSALVSDPDLATAIAHDAQAVAAVQRLLVESQQHEPLRALVTAVSALVGQPASPGRPALPGVPGHVRVIVQLRQKFVVDDLIVSTVPNDVLSEIQAAQVAAYATAVPTVNRLLRARIEPWISLPYDEAPPEVEFACLASSRNPIGRRESPEDGHSLALGLCVAAISHRLGWTLRHDRIVFTGAMDLEADPPELGRILGVEHIA